MTMKDDEKVETPLKFQSKYEIADCIRALTPFTTGGGRAEDATFATEKIKELTKLL